jgi:hypothetical protein
MTKARVLPSQTVGMAVAQSSWIDQELSESDFKDARLGKRFRILLQRLWTGVGESIPFVPRLGQYEGGVPILRQRAGD